MLCGDVPSGPESSESAIKDSFKGDNGKRLLRNLEEVFLENKCGAIAHAELEANYPLELPFSECFSTPPNGLVRIVHPRGKKP